MGMPEGSGLEEEGSGLGPEGPPLLLAWACNHASASWATLQPLASASGLTLPTRHTIWGACHRTLAHLIHKIAGPSANLALTQQNRSVPHWQSCPISRPYLVKIFLVEARQPTAAVVLRHVVPFLPAVDQRAGAEGTPGDDAHAERPRRRDDLRLCAAGCCM